MKKHYTLLLLLVVVLISQAQMLSPSVIANSGGFASNAAGSLSYTIGEMTMVQTFSANGNILTQGFQQPTESITGLISLSPQDEFGSFVVYPNPAVDHLSFGFQLREAGKVQITLYDVIGQKISDVYHANYQDGKIVKPLSVSEYPAGVYLLSMNFVSDKTGKTYTTSQKIQVIN